MNITLNPLRKAPDSLQCPSGEGPKRPSFFQRVVTLVLCAALFGGVAGGSFFARCPFQSLHSPAALLPAAELQTHPAYKSPRIKIHSPAAPGSYK